MTAGKWENFTYVAVTLIWWTSLPQHKPDTLAAIEGWVMVGGRGGRVDKYDEQTRKCSTSSQDIQSQIQGVYTHFLIGNDYSSINNNTSNNSCGGVRSSVNEHSQQMGG
ncbi:hypothetical protein LSH36_12g08055 [Paralvinella palmiformis]|uniref:Uncharacterized protein n=1 Tax=Paralvinella palmiformis TaxID=53620 RepID=A0AAD9KEL6_9ANNE|nr:hypothetical protein LSH36_12g08055 [Paralvinella palmiformis]